MATNVFDLYAKIGIDSSAFENGIGLAKKSMKDFGGFVKSGLGKIGDLVSAGVKKAASEATGFLIDSIKTGKNFDAEMAQVAATLGKSVDEVQDLRDFAKQMGESTRYSAMEAAQGLNYMALAGYDAEKSMKMLPEVMKLASAGGMQLGYASDVITDAQSALGLSIEQTSTLINQMAKAASSSNTSVSQLGEAILQIGGTAKDMKGGTLELATTLGILANNGIKGAEGGTALRNILTSLTGKEGKAAEALESMNVSLFDAQGNMRELNSVFSDMDKAMSKMTTQERKKMITTIFNARDMKSVEALLANAGTAWDDLTEKIRESEGAAADMSQTQEATLTGSITMMKSAIEGVKINISEFFTPVLTKIVNSGTSAIQTISASIGKVGEAFKKDGFMGLFTAFKDEFSKIKSEAISAGGEVLKNLLQSLSGDAKKIGEGAVQFISNFVNKLADSNVLQTIGKAALDIIDGIAEGFSTQESITAFFDAGEKLLTGLANGVFSFFNGENGKGGLLGAAEKIINNVSEWFENENNRKAFLEGADNFIRSLRDGMVFILGNVSDIMLAACKLFLDVFVGNIDYDHGADEFLSSLWTAIKNNAKSGLFSFINSDPDDTRLQELWYEHGGSMGYEEFKKKYIDNTPLFGIGESEEDILRRMGVYYNKPGNENAELSKKIETEQRAEQQSAFNRIYEQLQQYGDLYTNDILEYNKTHPELSDQLEHAQYLLDRRNEKSQDWYKIYGYSQRNGVNIPGFGDGAIVSKPTLAMIGERGEPEAVVPLGHETETSRALGFGGGVVIQFGDIYVSGSQDAGNEVIRNIDEALREWQLRQKRGIGGVAWQP